MNTRRRVLASAVLLVGILFVPGGAGTEALASPGTCTPYVGSTFDGYLGYSRQPSSWHETPEGVSGYILTRTAPSVRTFPTLLRSPQPGGCCRMPVLRITMRSQGIFGLARV